MEPLSRRPSRPPCSSGEIDKWRKIATAANVHRLSAASVTRCCAPASTASRGGRCALQRFGIIGHGLGRRQFRRQVAHCTQVDHGVTSLRRGDSCREIRAAVPAQQGNPRISAQNARMKILGPINLKRHRASGVGRGQRCMRAAERTLAGTDLPPGYRQRGAVQVRNRTAVARTLVGGVRH
jgi:hypothetical protein